MNQQVRYQVGELILRMITYLLNCIIQHNKKEKYHDKIPDNNNGSNNCNKIPMV